MSTKTKVWIAGAAVLCGALLLYGLLGGLFPQLASASSTRALAESAESQNDAYRIQLETLEAGAPRVHELEQELGELREALPETGASAAFLQQLHDIEESTGANVLRFEIVTLLGSDEPPADAAPEEADALAEGGAEAGPAEGVTGEPGEAAVPEVQGAQRIGFLLELGGESREDVANFVRQLQVGARLAPVDVVMISDEDGAWRGNVMGSLFVIADE